MRSRDHAGVCVENLSCPRPLSGVESSVRIRMRFIAMFRRDTPAEAEFRTEVRTWLEANLPRCAAGAHGAAAAGGTDALVSHAVAQGLDRAALAEAVWRHGRDASTNRSS